LTAVRLLSEEGSGSGHAAEHYDDSDGGSSEDGSRDECSSSSSDLVQWGSTTFRSSEASNSSAAAAGRTAGVRASANAAAAGASRASGLRTSASGSSTAAAGASAGAGRASGLRASASRLQAQLCTYHSPTGARSAAPAASPSGSSSGSILRGSTGGSVKLSSSSASLRRSQYLQGALGPGVAAPGDTGDVEMSRVTREASAAAAGHCSAAAAAVGGGAAGRAAEGAAGASASGGACSPTAAMLHKAAQLAMHRSLDVVARRSPSSSRLLPSQQQQQLEHSLRSAAASHVAGAGDDGDGATEFATHGPGRLSNTASDRSSHRGSHGSSLGSAAGYARRSSLPVSLEVANSSCRTGACVQLVPGVGQHRRSSSSDCVHVAAPGDAGWPERGHDLDALPGSAASSPGKDTSKGAVQCAALSLAACAAAALSQASARAYGGGTHGLRSPGAAPGTGGFCRAPYQQFKASAAAAAVAGKDQHQLTPGSKARRGALQTSPRAYMELQSQLQD
jgi:hypothetical protein